MRPGQNTKRMRGRPGARKGPNPLTRSYESSGPDVKIRGTAQHIGEKYLQLARDAQASGDPVMAESYLQHAEHYFRLIAAAQQAQQQQGGYGHFIEPAPEESEDDLDFVAVPDRFASPLERIAASQPGTAPQPQVNAPQPSAMERPIQGNGERQPFCHERGPRPERYHGAQERPYRENRPFPDRNGRARDHESAAAPGRVPSDYRNEPSLRMERRPEPQTAGPDFGPEAHGLPAFITAPVRIAPTETQDAPQPIEARPGVSAGEAEEPVTRSFHPRARRRRLHKPEAEAAGVGAPEAGASEPVEG